MEPIIYHITRREDWEHALASGRYEGDTLASEGFIHCSEAHQIERVANLRFRGRTDLVLVVIERARVAAEIVDEATEGVEAFPHIYGPLNVDAAREVRTISPGPDGAFQLP